MGARAILLALMSLGIVSSPALAAEDLEARGWAATCTGCHGTNGRSTGKIPSIAGRPQSDIVRLMREFRDGSRAATVMHQHAKGYSDDQVERIAAFFAAQKP
mgnify:CR=1 FL=1